MNNNKSNKKNTKLVINKKMIIAAINLSLFIILTILVLTKLSDPIDLKVESFILGIRNDKLTNIMIIITDIGRAYSLIAITFLITLIAILKNKKLPLYTIINLVSVFLTSQIFKAIIRRTRPTGVFLTRATGYSFPSGHAMVSFAYFTFIAYSLCEKINNNLLKMIIKVLTTILIISIGFSRIYLGVHYITDIIGGYLLGITYLMLFLNIREKNIKKEVKNERNRNNRRV